jgi:hypothetical protein
MRAIAASFSGLLNIGLSRLTVGHRDADLIEQISPDMLRRLLVEGIARAFVTYVLIVPVVFFLDRVVAPLVLSNYGSMSAAHYVISGGMLFATYIVTWRKSALASVDREILYCRLHRRWRWER